MIKEMKKNKASTLITLESLDYCLSNLSSHEASLAIRFPRHLKKANGWLQI